jgi:hypothetical protein
VIEGTLQCDPQGESSGESSADQNAIPIVVVKSRLQNRPEDSPIELPHNAADYTREALQSSVVTISLTLGNGGLRDSTSLI